MAGTLTPARKVARAIVRCGYALTLGAVLILAIVAGAARPAEANSGRVTVRLLPASVTLSAGDLATVDLVVSNTTASPVKIDMIRVRAPDSVAVSHVPRAADIHQIRSGRFVVRSFEIAAGPGIENGEVDVLVGIAGRERSEKLLTSSLVIKAGSADEAPRVTFVSFPQKLNDGQAVTAAVDVSNLTPFTLQQIRVTAVDSEDITLGPDGQVRSGLAPCPAGQRSGGASLGCLSPLAAGATEVLYLEMRASQRVQTGTQRVAVVVSGQADGPGEPITSTTVATASVQVTIFGVDALSPFGIGTLFVLPGLVTALTFLLLARYVYPRSKELPDTVQFKDPRTLLFVVPPAALIYLLVWALWGINLTNQAGTADVALLFGLGIGLGFVVWAAVAYSYYLHSGRKQFRVDDSPDKVLQRLQARHARLKLPAVAVGTLAYLYLSDGPAGKLVVCSPARYSFTDAADLPARNKFRRALDENDIDTIRDQFHASLVRLRWYLSTGVRLLDRPDGDFHDATDLLTEEDPADEDNG